MRHDYTFVSVLLFFPITDLDLLCNEPSALPLTSCDEEQLFKDYSDQPANTTV